MRPRPILPTLLCLLAIASLTMQQQMTMYIGSGYNVIRGNPLVRDFDKGFGQQIFQFSRSNTTTTEDGRYTIPPQVSHRVSSSCSLASTVSTYRGSDSYKKELSSKVSMSAGYKGRRNNFAFSASDEWKSMVDKTSNSSMTVSQASAECESYELSMDIFSHPNILPNFTNNVVSCYMNRDWSSLLDNYGTHYVYQLTMGGRTTYEASLQSQDVAEMNTYGVNLEAAVQAKFGKIYNDDSFNYEKNGESISYLEKNAKGNRTFNLGGAPPEDGNVTGWIQNVIDRPMPLKYKIYDITDLFSAVVTNQTQFDPLLAKDLFYEFLNTYCERIGCVVSTGEGMEPDLLEYELSESNQYYVDADTYCAESKFPGMEAREFTGRGDSFLYMVFQARFSDGYLNMYSEQAGTNMYASNNRTVNWVVPEGEFISQIEVNQGTDGWLYSIRMFTNTGKASPAFGEEAGGISNMQIVPQGFRLMGLRHCWDYDLLGSIRFYYAKAVLPVYEIHRTNMEGKPVPEVFYAERFEWKLQTFATQLDRVRVDRYEYIKGIQLIFRNGLKSPFFGEAASNRDQLQVFPSDLYLVNTTVSSQGNYLYKFKFTLYDGREWSFGSVPIGNKLSYTGVVGLYDNAKTIGIYGKSGEVLNAIGWIYAVRKNPIQSRSHRNSKHGRSGQFTRKHRHIAKPKRHLLRHH